MPMQKLIIALFITLGCACSKQEPLSAPAQKAKLMSEQIIDNASCKPLRDRLHSSGIDDSAIDAIYAEATASHCINKDI